jgi:hypothetical protein
MGKQLVWSVAKEAIEDAFLPFHCTVETRFYDRKKCLLYHVYDVESGQCLLTDICSPKNDHELFGCVSKSRDILEQQDGCRFYPWAWPY